MRGYRRRHFGEVASITSRPNGQVGIARYIEGVIKPERVFAGCSAAGRRAGDRGASFEADDRGLAIVRRECKRRIRCIEHDPAEMKVSRRGRFRRHAEMTPAPRACIAYDTRLRLDG